MNRLPPKPKGAPLLPHSLIAAALVSGGCASREPPRIGQPPPPPYDYPRIGAEVEPEDCGRGLLVLGPNQQPVPGVAVEVQIDGQPQQLTGDNGGRVSVSTLRKQRVEAKVVGEGYEPEQVVLHCDSEARVILRRSDQVLVPAPQPAPPPAGNGPQPIPPPRIGMRPRELEKPPARIGKRPAEPEQGPPPAPHGRVVDPSGEPLPHARVELLVEGATRLVRADADGRFVLDGVAPGPLTDVRLVRVS